MKLILTPIFILTSLLSFSQGWTWIGGDTAFVSPLATYGTKGVFSQNNKPGHRENSCRWSTGSNFWYFGGSGYDSRNRYGRLNDLWNYDAITNQWRWVSGSDTCNVLNSRGSLGISSTFNYPSSREGACNWIDSNGDLWIFGGFNNIVGSNGISFYNDLWKYEVSTNRWTFIKGSPNGTSVSGFYDGIGITSPNNFPSARSDAQFWIDNNGVFWLYSGFGYQTNTPSSSGIIPIRDLWKYDRITNQWTCVSDQRGGNYGTLGVPTTTTHPPNRLNAFTWVDNNNNLMLFGGCNDLNGPSFSNTCDFYNDVWKYNIATSQWTWLKGNNLPDKLGTYGVRNIESSTNNPGARSDCAGWKDNSGNIYIYGGFGYSTIGVAGHLNDMWKYNPTTNKWTWLNGDTTYNNGGIFGIRNVFNIVNKPPSKYSASSFTSNNSFYLLGGRGYSTLSSNSTLRNDFWKYTSSCSAPTPVMPTTINGPTDICPLIGNNSSTPFQRYYIDRVPNATAYIWSVPTGVTFLSGQGDTSINLVYYNTFTSGTISVKAVNTCGVSSAIKTLSVSKNIVSNPGIIANQFSPSVPAASTVCLNSSQTYRIRKVTNATSYNWYLKLGANAVITHINSLGANDTSISIVFNTGFIKDTICVKAINGCSESPIVIQALAAATSTPAILSINNVTGNNSFCFNDSVNYTVSSATPSVTQSPIVRYKWTTPSNSTITRSNSDSSNIYLKYFNGFIGGTITVRGLNVCGIAGSSKTILLPFLPPKPNSLASSNGSFNACVNNIRTFSVTAPSPDTTQRSILKYRWSRPSTTAILSANADSSSVTILFRTGYIGGTLSVRGQNACGALGNAYTNSLYHIGCALGLKQFQTVENNQDNIIDWNINPNPTNRDFKVKLNDANNKVATLKIFDIQGRLLNSYRNQVFDNLSFGEDLPTGIYIVQLSVGNTSKSIKVIKY